VEIAMLANSYLRRLDRLRRVILPCLCLGLMLGALSAARVEAAKGPIIDQLGLEHARQFFPAAVDFPMASGELPVREARGSNGTLGFLFLTNEISSMPAYSGKPITTLVAVNADASLQGAFILHHEEPILVIGITDTDLDRFLGQFRGMNAREKVRIGAHNRVGYIGIDGITGATITAMVLNASIMKTAKTVADTYGLPLPAVQEISPPIPPANKVSLSVPGITAPADSRDERIWIEIWQDQAVELIVLMLALTLLMGILFFQDWLVVHKTLFHRVRIGYLLFTVFFLGFYCKAQLSVINLLAFMRILFGGFTWDTLLLDPIIFTLWGFVAVSILLWGRGVFCGWLCPFGALQELIHKVAERLPLANSEFPPMVHERLWAIKYFILIALVGLSLESMDYAARLAEVEPFKTTFVMRFDREMWFVGYAWLLLLVAVFNSKFYCKYLCPLGAALSFFTRFRIFDWLRRRPDCGSPCQSCAAQCQISAIKPTGEIIDNECHYCLECQVTYWDDHRCPPLVEKRKKKEARENRSGGIIAREQTAD
jgi:NosR/NirI family nitrous oxide reductase transcriptional regulator